MNTPTPKKIPVFGPECWVKVEGCDWSYWDLWFVSVAVNDHAGSLESLENHLVQELGNLHGQSNAESKLSHVMDLRARLKSAGLAPDLLASPQVLADKVLIARARKKVYESPLEGRAMTSAMIEKPRVKLTRRACYGRWGTFPVDPERYYKSFRRHVEVKHHISESASFSAVHRVQERLLSLDTPSLSTTHRLALYRAFHTAGRELADRTDDSHGNVDQMRRDAWHTYLDIDWYSTGMRPEDYWADICDLLVSEDYGLGYEEETLPWANVKDAQAEMIDNMLLALETECRKSHLDYQAGEALKQQAWLALATEWFSRYVGLAERLGSDHWVPVVALAESAWHAARHHLSLNVFRAADQPGWHQQHLRDRCLNLTGVDLASDRHEKNTKLHLVEEVPSTEVVDNRPRPPLRKPDASK